MILELSVPASLVAIMLAIPLLVAPFRALVGFRSDTHRSILGWKRVPFLWIGTLHAVLAGCPSCRSRCWCCPRTAVRRATSGSGYIGTGLSFLLVGGGAHTTQTAGLALATDLVDEEKRPRVVALMYLMMLLGTLVSALALEGMLRNFSPLRLIQVIQGTAVFTVAVNLVSLWKQEARVRRHARRTSPASAARCSARRGARLPAADRPCACWWRPGSGSSPSTCRTCCSSRMAARSSG